MLNTSKVKSWIPSLLVLGIVVISLAGYFGLAIAQQEQESFRSELLELSSEKIKTQLLSEQEDISFGSIGITTTTTPSVFSGFTSASVTECYRIGDELAVDAESWTRCLLVQDFTDATITPVVLENPFDVDYQVYVRDLWLEVNGKASTTVRTAVTTSTADFIASDDMTILVDDSGAATIMRGLGNAFGNDGGTIATGTELFFNRFSGTDTDFAANTMPVVWQNDVNYLVFATSSGSSGVADNNGNQGIVASDNTFDGELYMIVDILK